MKNLIFTENDKFTSKTTITSLEMMSHPHPYLDVNINYRYVSAPEGEALLVDVTTNKFNGDGQRLNINEGELIFNINDTKNIRLKAHDNGSFPYTLGDGSRNIEEKACYNLTKEELLDLCEAQKIEIRLSGAHWYMTMPCNELIETARAMYNAIYDSSMYVEEVQKYEEEIRKVEEKNIEEAERAARTNKRHKVEGDLFAIGMIGGLVSALLALFNICHWIIPILCFLMVIILLLERFINR